jgi:hypothetical protein
MSRIGAAGERAPLVLVALCVVALGLSAATLTTATAPLAEDPTPQPKPIVDRGQTGTNTGGGTGTETTQGSYVDLQVCIEALTSPLAVLAIVALLGGVVALVSRFFTIAAGVIVGLVLIPPTSIAYFFLTNCAASGGGGGQPLPGGVGGLGSSGVGSPLPPWAAAGLAFAVVVGGAVAVFWSASGDDEFGLEEDEESASVDATDIADAAGDAADRIEQSDVDVDNEIYRAWNEMTSLLDVDSAASSTAGEFADAAVDAGLDEADVRELTELFEEVRYGTEEPSPEREERAVETLRRIESTYEATADEDAADAAGRED